MLKRVQRFIPWLEERDLVRRGTAGIRSSVIGPDGSFIKEAIEITGAHSFHILNYNSPGATGAPAYTAHLVKKIESLGKLSHMKKRQTPLKGIWDYERVSL
jgi:L-2-hydroxyglutarate oxidase